MTTDKQKNGTSGKYLNPNETFFIPPIMRGPTEEERARLKVMAKEMLERVSLFNSGSRDEENLPHEAIAECCCPKNIHPDSNVRIRCFHSA